MEKVHEAIAKERLILFQKEAEKIKFKYKESVNKKSLVLFENKVKNKQDEYFGRDEYSNSVVVKSLENLSGKIKEVYISNVNQKLYLVKFIII